MRVLDLFSGIGGFSLGLERAGMTTIAFCERDPYCRAVLAKHWPGVPCFDDIHALDADRLAPLGRIDLVCGGFPCQPFSVAGKQRAQADDRHLWPQMCRTIALARPAWVLGENVAGIIRLGLDQVLADLEAIGYAARPFVIPACAVDAPHRRDRVWIIACDAESESKSALASNAEMAGLRSDDADAASDGRQQGRPGSSGRARQSGSLCDAPDVVADTDGEGLEGRDRGSLQERADEWPSWAGGSHPADADGEPQRWLAEPRSERCEWRPEPAVGRVAHGVPRRVDRLRCLGNAVVPAVVEQLGRAILAAQAHAALTMQRS